MIFFKFLLKNTIEVIEMRGDDKRFRDLVFEIQLMYGSENVNFCKINNIYFVVINLKTEFNKRDYYILRRIINKYNFKVKNCNIVSIKNKDKVELLLKPIRKKKIKK
jgi:hypothetical protein